MLAGTERLEPDRNFKQLVLYLFAFSKGAELRYRIVVAIAEKPFNVNQLASALRVDYKAVQHHVNVLVKNKLIEAPQKEAYGALFFLTPIMEQYLVYVKEIWKKYGKRHNK